MVVGLRDLRIELARSVRTPEAVCVLDEAGERLTLERDIGEGRTSSSQELALCRARVSELARWLVLLRQDQELAGLPLSIEHGREARLRW